MPAVHLFWCTAVLARLHEDGIRFSYFMARRQIGGTTFCRLRKLMRKGE